MRREKRRFWFPPVRLCGFFVAVVIFGNGFFQTFRPSAFCVPEDLPKCENSLPKRMKRLERRIFRVLERFMDTPSWACSTEQESIGAWVPAPIESKLPMSRTNAALCPGPVVETRTIREVTFVPFAWPVPMTLSAGPEARPRRP
jgi:hypothetical protein